MAGSSTVALGKVKTTLMLLRLAPLKVWSRTVAAAVDSESGTKKPPGCRSAAARGARKPPAPASRRSQAARMNQRSRTTIRPHVVNGSAIVRLSASLWCKPNRKTRRLWIGEVQLLREHHDLAAAHDQRMDQRDPRDASFRNGLGRQRQMMHRRVLHDL